MKYLLLILFVSISLYGISQDSWISVADDKYYILMPGEPDTSTVQKYASGYGRYSVHTKTFLQINEFEDPNYSYALSATEYPLSFGISSADSTEYIDSGFEGAISSIVRALQGTYPSGSKKISVNGFPGREFVIEIKCTSVLVTSRLFLVNNTLYSLMVGTPKENAGNGKISKYLDSFTLKL